MIKLSNLNRSKIKKELRVNQFGILEDGTFSATFKPNTPLSPSSIYGLISEIEKCGVTNDLYRHVRSCSKHGQLFQYGAISGDHLKQEGIRAQKLFKDSVLDLPYPQTIFSSRVDCNDKSQVDLLVFAERKSNAFKLSIFARTNVPDEIEPSDVQPIMTIELLNDGGFDEDSDNLIHKIRHVWVNENLYAPLRELYMRMAIALVCGGCLILNTKGMPVTQSPDIKQFKGIPRDKDKNPYLVTVIDSKAYAKALNNTNKGSKGKCVHLRRGHTRTLADGRKLWISDVIVNLKLVGSKDAYELFGRDRYEVKSHSRKENRPVNDESLVTDSVDRSNSLPEKVPSTNRFTGFFRKIFRLDSRDQKPVT